MILLGFSASAEEAGRDSLVVSLITCAPGREVYELCGHSALRIRGEGTDSVWNYGIFDFNSPNFLYRFVKGETDYRLAGYPFAWFMPQYVSDGREVVEQELALTQDEARRFREILREEGKPENCVYRYNYVKDNCATRIVMRLGQAADERVIWPDTVRYGTFRNEMRRFHRNSPWYQFGIDLALGSGIDYPVRGEEEMFSPVDMMERFDGARFADGRPLVAARRVLSQGRDGATPGPTPWYLGPLAVSSALFLISLLLCAWQGKRRTVYRWIYTLWYGICGIAGCVEAFLVFFSEHEATSPNLLLIWLNPLQLLFAACVWSRRMRLCSIGMAWYDIVAVGCLLIVWPFQHQSANPAFFPLMGITVALAAAYAIITSQKGYINNNEKSNIVGVVRTRVNERGRAGSQRDSRGAASSRGRDRC